VVFPEDRSATTVLDEKRGRPEILDNKGKLGLILLYATSRIGDEDALSHIWHTTYYLHSLHRYDDQACG
jgi:hypothetical protein